MLDTLFPRSSLHFNQLYFIPLHYTCRHFTSSHLNFTQLHFNTLSFGLPPFKFPTAPFHRTSLHFTSLHFTALLNDFRHISIQCRLVFGFVCEVERAADSQFGPRWKMFVEPPIKGEPAKSLYTKPLNRKDSQLQSDWGLVWEV